MREIFIESSPSALPLYALSAAAYPVWRREQSGALARWLDAAGFRGEAGRLLLIPAEGGALAGAALGLGPDLDPLALAQFSQALPPGDYRIAHAPPSAAPARIALAWGLGAYRFDRYKKLETEKAPPRLVLPQGVTLAAAKRVIEAVSLVRDLVNAPANEMGPDELEAAAADLARRHGARLAVIRGDALLEANYPLIHAVGRASVRVPRLLDLVWGEEAAPRVTLVGKGVCFDSGGLDLKPAAAMLTMKKDMGGAANQLGLAHMIMDARLPVRLRLLVPAVENSVAGNAYRPGDIFPSRKGLTVEIGNTDAEGRLVLADALAEADSESPALLLNIATLTGAARQATGFELPPFFTGDEELAADLVRLSQSEADPMWRLPLWQPYDALVEGKLASLTNAPEGANAGAITAALFLKRFVTATKSFAHFDIAAWSDRARPGRPVGAEAQCIRALYALIRERFPRHG